MKFPTVASFILLAIFFGFRIHVVTKMEKKTHDDFFDRERQANSTRKKPLDTLPYIQLPLDTFPLHVMEEDRDIQECLQAIRVLSEKKIVNFSGYSNTDLKLTYGAPNITVLMEYDQNFIQLITTLQRWAELLLSMQQNAAAVTLLEFAVSIQTDVSKTYETLGKIYLEEGRADEITHLIQTAENLRSPSRDRILKHLAAFDIPALLTSDESV
jgi:hypothetical protein